jgi:hypothetical protein
MLIGAFGVGMIGAGCFTADPAFGFPPGTPPEANTISWHGIVHLSVATLGFAALIAAGFVSRLRGHGTQRVCLGVRHGGDAVEWRTSDLSLKRGGNSSAGVRVRAVSVRPLG